MTISQLPISYCTNLHPGRTVSEVMEGLVEFTLPARDLYGRDVAAGLWLAHSVTSEILNSTGGAHRLANHLSQYGFSCYTLNAFPFGDFHGSRVKEQVYLPDWTDPRRLIYTQQCAQILAALLTSGTEGSISTVPLGFKGFTHPDDFMSQCIRQLLSLAQFLKELEATTGRCIRLAIEPEPFCVLETIPETIDFFRALRGKADSLGCRAEVDRYLGICFDVCHQAVEYEDISESFRQLTNESIRINKLHITCAIQLDDPRGNVEGRRALSAYAEPRYLHQTIAQTRTGSLLRSVDLSADLALHPSDEYLDTESWRIHFHVPVSADSLGALGTTQDQLKLALQQIPGLSYAPHLEVETYTWDVMPGESANVSPHDRLIRGLASELKATRQMIDEVAR